MSVNKKVVIRKKGNEERIDQKIIDNRKAICGNGICKSTKNND